MSTLSSAMPVSASRCPVPGCGRGRRAGDLLCREHWLRVPAAMQRAVWDAFRRFERGAGSIEALRAAQGAAIRSVTPKAPAP